MDWDWNRACHLARLPLGSPEANDEWGAFQARLRLLAGRVAGSFGKSTAAADALASDVQAKLVSKPDRLCPTERTSTFDGWLFGVLKHQAIDNWRAMQRESKRVVVVDSDVLAGFPEPSRWSPDFQSEHLRKQALLLECCKKLEDMDQLVVSMKLEGRSSAEIGRVLRLSAGAVNTRYSRAKEELRRCAEEAHAS